MDTFKTLLRYFVLLLVVLALSFLLSESAGSLYANLFHEYGTWVNLSIVAGFLFAYTLFLPLFFTLCGDHCKYWWTGAFLIPILVVDALLHFSRAWIFVLLALTGWLLGEGFVIFRRAICAPGP